jgi:signal transduction histidine kinase
MDFRLDAGRPRAVIEVRDHGPGVPGEAVANLFTPFHRVVNGDTDTSNRTGLGLAITRRAFEVHGGTATAANAPGGGFVVTLEMPLRLQASAATPQAADDSPAASVA